MTALWDNQTAAQATGGKAQGIWQASRVEIDSRRIQPGDLFVALKGERFDGHDYVKDALAKGAAAAMVSQPGEGNCLMVPDTQKALEDLGRFARARSKAKIVGVTGSVGKTSAKEMLKLALLSHGPTHATAGNYNNHIGTPLSLANMAQDIQFAVFEMGMNHAGEITPLSKMVRPHVVAITNVEAVHQEFFPSVEAIADAKAEIFEGLEPSGIAVLNRDNRYYERLAMRARERGVARMATFGMHEEAECRLLDYRVAEGVSQVEASIYGEKLRYRLGSVGRHWAITSLLTLAAAHALGLDARKTAAALLAFREPEGRGRALPLRLKQGQALLIDDSYNASPASMRAAFAKTDEVWRSAGAQGRKLAALGDMLELGNEAPALHAALADELTRQGFDQVFTAGTLMQYLHEALPEANRAAHVEAAEQLLMPLRQALQPGDVLLVKGSHGSKMYALAKALQDALPQEAA